MKDKYKIEFLFDYYCETCGYSYESGYVIYKNDEVIIDKTPHARCYAGTHYDEHSPYKDILEYMRVEIEEIQYQDKKEDE